MTDQKHYERFMLKVNKTDFCWLWTGRKLKKTGRAIFRADGKAHIAARWLMQYLFGVVDKSTCVLHTCDNVACVNPAHLFFGTQLENIKDRDNKGRNRLAATHCVNNHEFTVANTRLYGKDKKWRQCRECAKNTMREFRKRKETACILPLERLQ